MNYPHGKEEDVESPGGVRARMEYTVYDGRQTPFPLSPMECWYLVQGWEVKLAVSLSQADQLDLPGRLEGSSNTYLVYKG